MKYILLILLCVACEDKPIRSFVPKEQVACEMACGSGLQYIELYEWWRNDECVCNNGVRIKVGDIKDYRNY